MRLITLLALASVGAAAQSMRHVSLADLRDKIEGGWAGQMIGVSYRRPHRVPQQRQDQRERTAPLEAGPRLELARTRTISTST